MKLVWGSWEQKEWTQTIKLCILVCKLTKNICLFISKVIYFLVESVSHMKRIVCTLNIHPALSNGCKGCYFFYLFIYFFFFKPDHFLSKVGSELKLMLMLHLSHCQCKCVNIIAKPYFVIIRAQCSNKISMGKRESDWEESFKKDD